MEAVEGASSSVIPTQRAFQSKSFIDFQNDVTAKDVEIATREGFRSIEHIKRYTTAGMATASKSVLAAVQGY